MDHDTKRRMRFASRLLLQSAFQDRRCPHCRSKQTTIAGRKWWLMQVRRCADCGLIFRWPKDSLTLNAKFYASSYREGIVTELPDDNHIELGPDLVGMMELLSAIVPVGSRVLDFGCSWGYLTNAVRLRGYRTVGFEICSRRAEFGRQAFGLEILDSYEALAEKVADESIDAIFAGHVMEHLPALDTVFAEFHRILRPQGQLLTFVPNCGNGRGSLRKDWKPMVGEKHSMAFDTMFFRRALPGHGFTCVVTATANGPEDYHAIARHFLRGESSPIEAGSEIVARAIRI